MPMDHGLKTSMRYPNHYVWLVFMASMDAIMTYLVLFFGGAEANPIARRILFTWGWQGMVVYKFALILLSIVICEIVGRKNDKLGRRFAVFAIIAQIVPVTIAVFLLVTHLGE